MLSIVAPAKINLFLHITGKRDDGYHNLESLITFADVGDNIILGDADEYSLQIGGPFAKDLKGQDNLITKAVTSFCQISNQPTNVGVTLKKNLPVASGIGGGSADAAATIYALLQYFESAMPDNFIEHLCAELGADVPVCFQSATAFVSGIGEKIDIKDEPSDLYAILVNPGKSLSTPEVFKNFKGEFRAPVKCPDFKTTEALIDFVKDQHNDLQAAAIELVPEIQDLLDALDQNGAEVSRLSGSGATCFGLFTNEEKRDEAYLAMKDQFPNFWLQKARLGNEARF